jgi:hypothetical protein
LSLMESMPRPGVVVGAAPILRALADRIGLVPVMDQIVAWDPERCRLSPGERVLSGAVSDLILGKNRISFTGAGAAHERDPGLGPDRQRLPPPLSGRGREPRPTAQRPGRGLCSPPADRRPPARPSWALGLTARKLTRWVFARLPDDRAYDPAHPTGRSRRHG